MDPCPLVNLSKHSFWRSACEFVSGALGWGSGRDSVSNKLLVPEQHLGNTHPDEGTSSEIFLTGGHRVLWMSLLSSRTGVCGHLSLLEPFLLRSSLCYYFQGQRALFLFISQKSIFLQMLFIVECKWYCVPFVTGCLKLCHMCFFDITKYFPTCWIFCSCAAHPSMTVP